MAGRAVFCAPTTDDTLHLFALFLLAQFREKRAYSAIVRMFRGKLERTNSCLWDGLVGVAGELPAPELLDEVRRAYAEGLADETVAGLEDIEREFACRTGEARKR